MTKKIVQAFCLVIVAVLVLFFALAMTFFYRSADNNQREQLAYELQLAAQGVEGQGMSYLEQLDDTRVRFTYIDKDGTVLYDTATDAAKMENHADRAEVQEALAHGEGKSARFSKTLTRETLYHAQRLSDGKILRIAVDRNSIVQLVLSLARHLFIIFILGLLFSIVLARRLSNRIVAPINSLNLEHPLDNDTYPEIAPLLTRMAQQQRYISEQEQTLSERRSEFEAVTSRMEEGLVMLNSNSEILSINNAASRFFQAPNAIGTRFVTLERSLAVHHAIEEAAQTGHASVQLQRDKRSYTMRISRIGEEKAPLGSIILIIDETEKVLAERQRREFTANVSHELKTPLHTIMGSAELVEHGLVKSTDLPRFMERIRHEAARLLEQIEQIIRLSQLDEGAAPPAEEIDLQPFIQQELQRLEPFAKTRQVSLHYSGTPATIHSVPQLLHEIVYNLIDNAIKYNHEQGEVQIQLADHDDSVSLTIADNGIGIDPSQQERIFERFYRVDQSHSRAQASTGLGLAIVKHAADHLHANIHLDSALGKGTTITVTFPKNTPQ